MSEEEEKYMEKFGITSEKKSVYYYNGNKYDDLKSAINYAKIDSERDKS